MALDLENDATYTDAVAALEGAEANETPIAQEAIVQTDDGTQQSDDRTQSAEDSGDGVKLLNDSTETDTRATADKGAAGDEKKDETETQGKTGKKPGDKPALGQDGKPLTPYAADRDRLDKTWKSVNERKATLDTLEKQIKQRELTIAQREQKAAVLEAKSRNKFTPDQYLTAGQNKLREAETLAVQADGMDRRAEQLEAAGKYGEAELAKRKAQELRDQSTAARGTARQMEQMADHLRKNPDPTLEQHKATLESHKKHYLLEAAKRWPEVAVANSEFQKTMATHLQAAAQQGLDPAENPSIFYHVARLTAAETAAARVPDLVKQLGAAQAKIKELEALTAPGGGKGSAQTQPASKPLTDDEEGEALRQEAAKAS